MKTYYTLVRKELQQFTILLRLPLVIIVLMLLAAIAGGLNIHHISIQINTSFPQEINFKDGLGNLTLWLPLGLYLMLLIAYVPKTLRHERLDRSILFWRATPVSDTRTVLVKFFTALYVIPLLCLAVLVVTDLLFIIPTLFDGLKLSFNWSSMLLNWWHFIERVFAQSLILCFWVAAVLLLSLLSNSPLIILSVICLVLWQFDLWVLGNHGVGQFINQQFDLLSSMHPWDQSLSMGNSLMGIGLPTLFIQWLATVVFLALCIRLRGVEQLADLLPSRSKRSDTED